MFIAHTANEGGRRHGLTEHLVDVSEIAAGFARNLGAEELGRYLGLWHDLGKFTDAFQEYLISCEENPALRGHGPDHKAAGAELGSSHLGPLALAIQGHHGGLQDRSGFKSWLDSQDEDRLREALDRAAAAGIDLEPPRPLELPAFAQTDRRSAEMFVRMAFSTLVDADYLDTERHFRSARSQARGSRGAMADLAVQVEKHIQQLAQGRTGPVADARRTVHEACLLASGGPTGLYKLAAPTGAGKTLSAMAFALRHAVRHGMERVIVAVPFISITEQTAEVYRHALAEAEDGPTRAVLEHHSSVTEAEDGEDFRSASVWRRLAAENWDAPIVVTTTVQLFESLFSNKPSRCRKLHRLAKSVIIIDEAQALPSHLLRPILDGLRHLCEHYGTSVVISTATQPTFEAIREFNDLPAQDIIGDTGELFRTLNRVEYEWRIDDVMDWPATAALLSENEQGLAVLNTKKDALALLDALDDPQALHLSTLLCGAHRRATIAEVKRRLEAGEPCRLVSTQVVEAGVDLDFPFVMRALGPLDAVIQAAGRCNREGRLHAGRVVVFQPADGGSPPGAYRAGIGITSSLMGEGRGDAADPALSREYFRRLFESVDTDRERIQDLREVFNYPEVAHRMRLIDDETESVAISTYGTGSERARVRELLERLKAGAPEARMLLRQLQPYLVSLRRREAEHLQRQGLIADVTSGVGEWLGEYHHVRGVVAEGLSPDSLVI